jgi:hypothetical protein
MTCPPESIVPASVTPKDANAIFCCSSGRFFKAYYLLFLDFKHSGMNLRRQKMARKTLVSLSMLVLPFYERIWLSSFLSLSPLKTIFSLQQSCAWEIA